MSDIAQQPLEQQREQEPKKETVALWGDSLAKGVIWNGQRGRHAYAQETAVAVAERELDIRIINRARFGYTAPQGLALMEKDLDGGMTADAAVIEFGGNDCNFNWQAISDDPEAEHQPNTLPHVFADTLRRMVTLLRERGIRPILMTLPPIDAEKYFRFLVGDKLNAANILRWLGDKQRIYRFQEMYSLLIERVARQMQCMLVDLCQSCLLDRDMFFMLCDDGLHLTDEGQRFIGAQVVSLVREG